ncbi:hypothetical protein WCE39_13535 [Luteimonas sp. MJ174]|uniref:hypothetical protein n=1 Tax=Luteimonas sp. MJ174 TaxID=3129237 RepID=UPI0031BA4061
MLEVLSAVANVATAVAVMVAAWQLVLSKRQAITTFEDSLAKEYRDIAATLPVKALLGESLSDAEQSDKFDEFYRYFDLCNQQAFLRQTGRVSDKTWKFWQDGIASNLKRPAFAKAWSDVAQRSNGDFSELRGLFPPRPEAADDAGGA